MTVHPTRPRTWVDRALDLADHLAYAVLAFVAVAVITTPTVYLWF